ncbi:hypothetical protein E0H35_02965 [Rhizobium leguminosarum bv. viciae]|nr:hypothetical protein [Rhizobium leguminosarum]NKL56301.1 hypothetical protein [Rhizobium leguminosarum bv. viciae]NEI02459.1 hypothetical protein [Rhizobium leguminosarum]NEI59641.1 hypothetical protein [Rhizobium leguminosarum]NEI88942.1 hypothetical protein [Rhizobium leguminosarum]
MSPTPFANCPSSAWLPGTPELLHNSLNRNRFKDKIMQQLKVLQRPLRVLKTRGAVMPSRRVVNHLVHRFTIFTDRKGKSGDFRRGADTERCTYGKNSDYGRRGLPAVLRGPGPAP